MISFIDRDEKEAKLCYSRRYGMKFKSYKSGFSAGKKDAKDKKNINGKTKCPFNIPPDVYDLLRKRARWLEGYEAGWNRVGAGKRKKNAKRKDA